MAEVGAGGRLRGGWGPNPVIRYIFYCFSTRRKGSRGLKFSLWVFLAKISFWRWSQLTLSSLGESFWTKTQFRNFTQFWNFSKLNTFDWSLVYFFMPFSSFCLLPLKMKGKVSFVYETANYLFSFGIIHFVVNIFFSTYLKILLRCVWYWNLGKFFIFTFFTLPWYFKIRLWVILQLYDQQNALLRFNWN